jgi:hypothetical protein
MVGLVPLGRFVSTLRSDRDIVDVVDLLLDILVVVTWRRNSSTVLSAHGQSGVLGSTGP